MDGQAISIESRRSWVAAGITLLILSLSYGSPLLVVVGLKDMTEAMHTDRSVVALAGALVWVGTGAGGIVMGWLADRIGLRAVVAFGTVMTGLGLAVSTHGSVWALYLGHGLLVGFLGNGAIYAPLLIYVSRWFDRRRGTAIALISSGQYIAGVIWPSIFQAGIGTYGWASTMLAFAAVVTVSILPLLVMLTPAPEIPVRAAAGQGGQRRTVLGMHPNVTQALICAAAFCCCVPMAVPSSHLVAFCSDIGITPARGAAMLSVLLACAFISRQFWGALADRIGGLRTVLAGSACQAVAIAAFMLTQDEVGLFAISAAFGLGFSGIIPSYSVAIRDHYPSAEASWRIPTVLFSGMSGMAFGSWFAGALYDHFGFYGPAFVSGVLFNLLNLAIVGFLVTRVLRQQRMFLQSAEA
ncbi:MAG: MFS transporter [Acetobacteraceae bacterium]